MIALKTAIQGEKTRFEMKKNCVAAEKLTCLVNMYREVRKSNPEFSVRNYISL